MAKLETNLKRREDVAIGRWLKRQFRPARVRQIWKLNDTERYSAKLLAAFIHDDVLRFVRRYYIRKSKVRRPQRPKQGRVRVPKGQLPLR